MIEVDRFMDALKNNITHAKTLHNVGALILEHGAKCLRAVADFHLHYRCDGYTLSNTSGYGTPRPIVRLTLSGTRGRVKVIKYTPPNGKDYEEVHVINNQGVEYHIREAITNDLV